MIYKNEDALAKEWKAGTRHGAYFFHGGENYLIERWAGQVMKEAGGDTFNLHKFNGKKLDVDALYEAVEALPLMAERKYVFVDDLDWKGMPAPEQKKLEAVLTDLPPDCVLVATAKAPAFDSKSAGGKKIAALFDKAGCAAELGPRGTSGQTAFLKSEAKKGGCTISSELCRHILDTCENDMLSIQAEMAKLCAYAGGGELTRAQADAVCTPKTEARVFDLSKAILAGNAAKTLELLDNLFYLRESPVMILAVLIRSFADIYRARVARDEGRSADEVVGLFGYKGREFIVRGSFASAAGLSTGYLREALDILYRCDRDLKSSPADDRVLLEQAVVELFVLASPPR